MEKIPRERKLHLLRVKAQTCFLCKWILHDVETTGKLSDGPKNANLQSPLFPEKSKRDHLKLEGFL